MISAVTSRPSSTARRPGAARRPGWSGDRRTEVTALISAVTSQPSSTARRPGAARRPGWRRRRRATRKSPRPRHPHINGSSAAGMAASDEAEMTSARAMVKVAYPDKEQRAAVHWGTRKENGGPRCQPRGRASPDHGHDIGGDLATIEYSSTPWRSSTPWLSSTARMEAAAGDSEVTSATARPPVNGSSTARTAATDEAEMTTARAMVKVRYPDKEQRAAVHRGAPRRKRWSSMPTTRSSVTRPRP